VARQIEAYKLRTELNVDAVKGSAAIKGFQKDVDNLTGSFDKLGKQIDKSSKGKEAGYKFGKNFGAAATTAIEGSFDELGKTIGGVIGTAIAPGLGTVIGSTIGSGIDKAVGKLAAPMKQLLSDAMSLNETIESTTVEFTTFTGSVEEAKKYMGDLQKLAEDIGKDPRFLIETSERVYDLTSNLKLTDKILKAATDQAADFGGSAETIGKVADVLGLIAEKGEIATRDLKSMYKLGIDAKQYLAEGFGLSVKQVDVLIKENRIRGEIAAQIIAEGIERKKAGFAARLARETTAGKRGRFETRALDLAATATEPLNRAIGDAYEFGGNILRTKGADQFVNFIKDVGDKAEKWTKEGVEKAVGYGVNLTTGLIDGMTGSDAYKAISEGVSNTASYLLDQFGSIFEMKSPSKLMDREVGQPLGEGIADGIAPGFVKGFYKVGGTRDSILAEIEKLLQDPRVRALLETIKAAEGGAPGRIVGYGGTTTDLSRHPNKVGLRTSKGASTAAGSYQITYTNWKRIAAELGLPDFTEPSQMMAALKIMLDRGGLGALTSGDPEQMMKLAARDWSSTPGQTIGGGKAWSRSKWLGTYQQKLAGITGGTSAPVPVAVVQWQTPASDIQGAAGQIFGTGRGGGRGSVAQQAKQMQTVTVDLGAAIAETTYATQDLIKVDADRDKQLARSVQIVPRQLESLTLQEQQTLAALEQSQQDYAAGTIAITDEYQEALRAAGIRAQDVLGKLSGAVAAGAGYIPQQQTVGKKRGLFSKILGFAAPFLSFIPGVGPLLGTALSTIAGAASQGLAGNYGGMATTIATGLTKGGAFRPERDERPVAVVEPPHTPGSEHRVYGGPVYAGRSYTVGERGSETFTPSADGFITPHGGGEMLAAVAELRGAIEHLNAMPASAVVMRGARGLVKAMDHDAGLIRLTSQRMRLA